LCDFNSARGTPYARTEEGNCSYHAAAEGRPNFAAAKRSEAGHNADRSSFADAARAGSPQPTSVYSLVFNCWFNSRIACYLVAASAYLATGDFHFLLSFAATAETGRASASAGVVNGHACATKRWERKCARDSIGFVAPTGSEKRNSPHPHSAAACR
jgi:hypothetical protein